MAMNSLHLRPIRGLPDDVLIYRSCEAKFSAETADGVGAPHTTVFTIGRNDTAAGFFTQATINEFRKEWERWRAQPPSPAASNLIAKVDVQMS